MRSVVTIKNHCLKRLENFNRTDSATGGAKQLGGYNPLTPNNVGGYLGDVHIGKFDDVVNLYDPSVTRRLKSTSSEISFNFDFQGKTHDKILETGYVEI